MTLYFAYGSNMSRAMMRLRCPSAREVATAALAGYRFIVMVDGYASVVASPGGVVHGLLWRLAPRDLAALNSYEIVDQGLYRIATLPVRIGARRVAARIYVGRSRAPGPPRPGYLETVLDAARELNFPAAYVHALARWLPSGLRAKRSPESGEVA